MCLNATKSIIHFIEMSENIHKIFSSLLFAINKRQTESLYTAFNGGGVVNWQDFGLNDQTPHITGMLI